MWWNPFSFYHYHLAPHSHLFFASSLTSKTHSQATNYTFRCYLTLLLLSLPALQQERPTQISHHRYSYTHNSRASICTSGRMLCVCRRSKDMRRIEVGVSISCWTCQTLQRSEQDAGPGGEMVCGRRCVQVVGCWSRRAAQRHKKEEQRQQQQQEEEEEEERPMTPRGLGGIVLEDGQLPPTEPRLMRCRAVRRDWNLDELCKEVGVA